MSTKLKFLGGVQEVGKSAILLESKSAQIVMDYGVKIQPEPGEFPPVPERFSAVIPTHSHLDHCGAVPILAKKCPVYCTNATADTMNLLLEDFLKVARINGYPKRFSKEDIKKTMKNTKTMGYEKQFNVKDVSLKLFDAGHIPGSSGILASVGGKKIYYTGDTKLEDQRLVRGCKPPKDKIDVLMIESTYGDRDHPDRKSQEAAMRSEIDGTLNLGEHVIIPVFAVGRAQEILLMLKGYENYICMDGMAKAATEIAIRNKNILKNPEELKAMFSKIKKAENDRQRDNVLKKPSIIITTSGMMNGGPAVYYLRQIREHKDSKIIFVGYQVDDSPGKVLFDTHVYRNEEEEFDVSCKMSRFDFSAHAGRNELLKIIKNMKPKQVVCVHGDHCNEFAKTVKIETGIDAIAPKIGDTLDV